MALRIAPTPTLMGKETSDFLIKLNEDLKRPAKLVPTPKLKKAIELIEQNAISKKKFLITM